MAASTLVLMYHAIPGSGRAALGADGHYSVDMQRFVAQLSLMNSLGLRPRSVRDRLLTTGSPSDTRPVSLTFDDGHETNFAAYAEIVRWGGSADLFINPSTVGQPGFLTWSQLRELARHGASIQSHGQHHVFLDELPLPVVRCELADSRERIQQELGVPAILFAPPNGRMPPRLAALAREQGYAALCSSRVGLWHRGRHADIPRFAVLANTSEAQLRAWLERQPWEMARSQVRAAALSAGKRLLGRDTYLALRSRLLRAPPRV